MGHAVNHPFMTMRGPRIKWKYRVEWMRIGFGKHCIKIRNESVNNSKACSCWKRSLDIETYLDSARHFVLFEKVL